jgi:hypothetical protein
MSSDDRRLRFERAILHTDQDGSSRVEVAFTFGGQAITASAISPDPVKGPLKAAVLATLDAVERAVSNRLTCNLADLDHVSALGKKIIAVLVNIEFDGQAFQLFGSCQLAGSEIDVAVKAALNATNRFVELALDS